MQKFDVLHRNIKYVLDSIKLEYELKNSNGIIGDYTITTKDSDDLCKAFTALKIRLLNQILLVDNSVLVMQSPPQRERYSRKKT